MRKLVRIASKALVIVSALVGLFLIFAMWVLIIKEDRFVTELGKGFVLAYQDKSVRVSIGFPKRKTLPPDGIEYWGKYVSKVSIRNLSRNKDILVKKCEILFYPGQNPEHRLRPETVEYSINNRNRKRGASIAQFLSNDNRIKNKKEAGYPVARASIIFDDISDDIKELQLIANIVLDIDGKQVRINKKYLLRRQIRFRIYIS